MRQEYFLLETLFIAQHHNNLEENKGSIIYSSEFNTLIFPILILKNKFE